MLTEEGAKTPFSIIGGAGTGSSSTFFYAGMVTDLVSTRRYTLSTNLRYNQFHWDYNFNDQDDAQEFLDDIIETDIEDVNGSYSYLSANVSNTFWFTPRFGGTLALGALLFLDETDDLITNHGLKFHFKY